MADETTATTEAVDEVTLTQITYTAARSGNAFIKVPGIGPVAQGQAVWVSPEDAEYYAVELIDINGDMTADFEVGEEWSGTREEADEKRKAQEESAAAVNKINAAGIVDAHPTVIEEEPVEGTPEGTEAPPEATPQAAPEPKSKSKATEPVSAPEPAPATEGAAV